MRKLLWLISAVTTCVTVCVSAVMAHASVPAIVIGLIAGTILMGLMLAVVPVGRAAASVRSSCNAPAYTSLGKVITSSIASLIGVLIPTVVTVLVVICVTAAGMSNRLSDAEQNYKTVTATRMNTEKQIADEKSALELEIINKTKDLETEMNELIESRDALIVDSEYEKKLEELEGLKTKLEVVTKGGEQMRIRIAQQDVDAKQAEIDKIDTQLVDAQQKIESLQAKIDNTRNSMTASVQKSIDDLQANVTMLETSEAQAQADVAQQKGALDDLQSHIIGYVILITLCVMTVWVITMTGLLWRKSDLFD